MKNSLFLCLTLGVVLLSSCLKEPKPEPVGEARVKAVNTVKGSNPQEFYQNGSKKNDTPIAYGESTGYITLTSGTSQFAFGDVGSEVANAATQAVGLPIGANATVFYLKVINQTTLKESLASTIINDDMTPSQVVGKARVRIVHLNYFLNNSISVLSGTKELLTGIPFGYASSYIDVDPGTKFTFGGDGVTTSPIVDGNLVANKNYTIWVDGTSAKELNGHVILQN